MAQQQQPQTPLLPPAMMSTNITTVGPARKDGDANATSSSATQQSSSTQPATPTRTATKPSAVPYASPRGQYISKRVFKVIMIGDANVGKTCLSFRFCNARFPAQTEATIGVDFRERTLAIDNELIRVQLWDTAGQERFRQSIVPHYYRNVNAVVFVYDVNSVQSFNSLPTWINECRKHNVSSNEVPHILIANKCDVKTEGRVRTDVAQVFADKNDMALFETSALAESHADNVEAIFMTLVHKLQQCKLMHVQSEKERNEKDQTLLLKANDQLQNEASDGWCC